MKIYIYIGIALIVFVATSIMLKDKSDVVTIGVIAPQSGGGAAFGMSLIKGIEMAHLDSGRNVRVVYEDDGGDPVKAASAAQKLINVDKVKAILTVTGPTANAVKKIAEDNQVIHIADTADSTVGSGNYNFTNSIVPTDEMPAWLQEAASRGVKTMAVLYQNHPGIIPSISLIDSLSGSYGIQIVHKESFDGKQGDYKTIALKAKQSNADMYFVAAYPPSLDIVSKGLMELGVKDISTYSLFAISPTPELYNGKWYTDANLGDISFKERFEKVYPDIRFNVRTAPYGYDMFNMAILAIQSGDTSKYLKELASFEGKVGPVIKKVGENNFRSQAAVWVIEDGRAEIVKSVPLQ